MLCKLHKYIKNNRWKSGKSTKKVNNNNNNYNNENNLFDDDARSMKKN